MALKLIWRNIQRSGGDYLLLALTVTLLAAILCLANCIAVFGSIQAGFQTASLPVLIVIILFLLINTIHTFMLHQRAQALAVTLLLGMERRKLRRFYLGELCVIGIGCFLLGTLLGASLFSVVISPLLQIRTNTSWLSLMRKSILQTGGYFFLAELLSGMRIDRQLASLQISQLLVQKRCNHPIHRKNLRFWQRCFTISFALFLIFLIGIAAAQGVLLTLCVGGIALPMLACIIAFYQSLYAYFSHLRSAEKSGRIKGNRLLWLAELTTGAKTSANLNALLCVCLVFAASAFGFGMLLLDSGVNLFEGSMQTYMGFMQISLCLIFLILYFSALSLLQILDLKRQARSLKILHALGKDRASLNRWVCIQTLFHLGLPAGMGLALLTIAAPLINFRLNAEASAFRQNQVLRLCGSFGFCFCALYLVYFLAVTVISRRNLKSVIES